MRLVDKVTGAAEAQQYPDDPAGRRSVQGAGAFRDLVANCQLRYVLDREASSMVGDVARRVMLVPAAGDDFARPPADLIWFEYYCDRAADGSPGRRVGAVAEFDPDGRSGVLIPFGERRDGGADFLQGAIKFDWDAERPSFGLGVPEHRVRQADLPSVDQALAHARTIVSETWLRRCDHAGIARTEAVRMVCESTWPILPTLIAFCVVLNAGRTLSETRSNLGKVNAARIRGGRPLLLDHVEVKLDLGARAGNHRDQLATGHRATPRLHLVRGHVVTRGGASFWRSSHLRGEGDAVQRKTVAVTSRAGAIYAAANTSAASCAL